MADNEQQPADDLRSLLAGAIDESAASAGAGAADAKPVPKADADADASADKGDAKTSDAEPKSGDDRPRGEDGKFVKKSDDDKKAEGAADDKKPDAKADESRADSKTDAEKDTKTEPKTADGKDAPSNWSASDKAMFKLQSPDAQAFLLKKVKELESGFTKKTEAIADLRKEFEPVQQLFAPHIDVLKQKGLSPQTVIKRWADVETGLATPGRNVDVVANIIKAYNVDKAALAKSLGFTSTPSGQASTDTLPAAGDQTGTDVSAQMLAALEEKIAKSFEPKLARIDQWETAQRNAAMNAEKARETAVETEISNFKSATNDKGELLHPYFDELEQDMLSLAQSYQASNRPLPKIGELYETAVWANPSTRTAMLATQKAAEQVRQAEEARSKSRQAQRAASSVTGAPGTGQASRPVRGELSLREQLEEAFGDNAA